MPAALNPPTSSSSGGMLWPECARSASSFSSPSRISRSVRCMSSSACAATVPNCSSASRARSGCFSQPARAPPARAIITVAECATTSCISAVMRARSAEPETARSSQCRELLERVSPRVARAHRNPHRERNEAEDVESRHRRQANAHQCGHASPSRETISVPPRNPRIVTRSGVCTASAYAANQSSGAPRGRSPEIQRVDRDKAAENEEHREGMRSAPPERNSYRDEAETGDPPVRFLLQHVAMLCGTVLMRITATSSTLGRAANHPWIRDRRTSDRVRGVVAHLALPPLPFADAALGTRCGTFFPTTIGGCRAFDYHPGLGMVAARGRPLAQRFSSRGWCRATSAKSSVEPCQLSPPPLLPTAQARLPRQRRQRRQRFRRRCPRSGCCGRRTSAGPSASAAPSSMTSTSPRRIACDHGAERVGEVDSAAHARRHFRPRFRQRAAQGPRWRGDERSGAARRCSAFSAAPSRFGFVFQQSMLIPELSAGENVALPLLLLGHDRAAAFRARCGPQRARAARLWRRAGRRALRR